MAFIQPFSKIYKFAAFTAKRGERVIRPRLKLGLACRAAFFHSRQQCNSKLTS
jgi:hypothetical protein